MLRVGLVDSDGAEEPRSGIVDTQQSTRHDESRPLARLTVVASAACATAAILFAIIYVRREQPIYVWDARTYWEMYFSWGSRMRGHLDAWLPQLQFDVWTSEYNALPSVLLSPFYRLFGAGRAPYIAALTTTYLVPTALLLARAAGRAVPADAPATRRRWYLVFLVLAFLALPLWEPTLRGFPDIAGCIPILLLVSSLEKSEWHLPRTVPRQVWLGVLLWLPFLLRKWYAYTTLSLVLALAGLALLDLVERRRTGESAVVSALIALRALLVIGTVFTVCVLATQGGLVWHILHTSYAEIYSAYQPLDWRVHVINFYRHFGLLLLGGAALGAVFGLHEAPARRAALFFTFNAVVTTFAFTRTQAILIQHYLPISLWLLLLFALAVRLATDALQSRARWRATALAGIAGLYILGFDHALMNTLGTLYLAVPGLAWILPLETHYPVRNFDNLGEYEHLSRDLEGLVAKGGAIAVFASNGNLCDSLLESVSGERLDSHFIPISHVDRRDHFDVGPLMAEYVVVADPIQLHLRPSDQHVVSIAAQEILDGTGIGHAYERLPGQYSLQGGSKAFIFRRTREVRLKEIETLLADLFRFYPEWASYYGDWIPLQHFGPFHGETTGAGIDRHTDLHLHIGGPPLDRWTRLAHRGPDPPLAFLSGRTEFDDPVCIGARMRLQREAQDGTVLGSEEVVLNGSADRNWQLPAPAGPAGSVLVLEPRALSSEPWAANNCTLDIKNLRFSPDRASPGVVTP